MIRQGYDNARAFVGGIQEWQRRDYPLEGEYTEVPLKAA